MRIGVDIGLSKSPDAATFAEVVAGLGYNYTWAADFSGLTTTDMIFSVAHDTREFNADGVRVAHDASVTASNNRTVKVDQTYLSAASHSFSSADFPDGSLPDIHDGAGATAYGPPTNVGEAEFHPGRYITVVATFHKMDLPDDVNFPALTVQTSAGSLLWIRNVGSTRAASTILNGAAITLGGTQASYDAILNTPVLITFDMFDSSIFCVTNTTDDPSFFEINPAYNVKADYDVTYHGIILSDVPPSVALGFTLPVEISNPSIT